MVAERVRIDPAELAYREDLVAELREQHRHGVPLFLATSAHIRYAAEVAAHLGIFAGVIATDGGQNLSGEAKAAALVERFGARGFQYIGNDWVDLPVWQAAAVTTVVGGRPRLIRHVRASTGSARTVSNRRGGLEAFLTALRPHQWAKNALVFVPVLAAHKLMQVETMMLAALTFASFSLCASGIYILNDISDIAADRRHARKRRRPFAAGDLSIPVGILLAAILLALSGLTAWLAVSWRVAALLGSYVIVTTAYTLRLKRVPVVDVFTLTGLYVLRITAGAVATGTTMTTWLLAFALFFFLGLAFVKRFVEVMATRGQLPGREYGPDDAMWMHAIGTTASYMAVVVLALYVNTPEVTVLYSSPDVLWLLCPLLLFWVTRLWFRAGRRLIHDDPVVDTLRDPLGYVTLAAAAVILLGATV
jgi:4-hydroxybenzoate polyprenyltransferase